jgi:hypothetical protein
MICSILLGAILSISLNNILDGWSVIIAGITAGSIGYFAFLKEPND